MKYSIILIMLFYSALGFAQEAEFFFFDKTTIKFPKTNEGALLSHFFVFENSGNQPLLIQDAKVSCTCTKVTFPTHPILPGQKDSVWVQFDTNQKSFHQDRTIELLANSKKKQILRFKVYVIPKGDE